MKKFFLLFLTLCSFSLLAQHQSTGKIITVHPSLGAHVLPDEKQLYSLFPEYPDSLFLSAQFVKYNDSTFTVLFQFRNEENKREVSISKDELWEIHKKVEKVRPSPAPPASAAEKSNDKYQRFIKGLDAATEALGYTVLWSVRLLNVFLTGEWE